MAFFEEELLEPLARELRFTKGLSAITKHKPLRILDLGCGPKIRFFHAAKKRGLRIKYYLGIDPLVSKKAKQKNSPVAIIKTPLAKTIPLPNNSLDLITGFAFLEHIDHPQEILNEAIRVLARKGKIVLTTPTPRAKTILEFLSYKLRIIARREIEEHKNYFTKENLLSLIHEPKQVEIRHQYFEFGCNNLLVIKKI